nr:hypothetical protein [Halorubrum halodurans]
MAVDAVIEATAGTVPERRRSVLRIGHPGRTLRLRSVGLTLPPLGGVRRLGIKVRTTASPDDEPILTDLDDGLVIGKIEIGRVRRRRVIIGGRRYLVVTHDRRVVAR